MTKFRILMCGLLLGVVLAGCSNPPPPAPVAFDESFQVISVSTRLYEEAEIGAVHYSWNNTVLYPSAKYGLNEKRVLADFKKVMADSLIPASRQGTREVRAEFILTLLGDREHSPYFHSNVGGDLNFFDVRTGERLAQAKVLVSPKFDTSSVNVLQEYNTVLRLTKEALPKYLPRP